MILNILCWSVIAGSVATLAMTLFTEAVWLLLRRPYHVIRTLSVLLQYGKEASIKERANAKFYFYGFVLHYVIGIAFAYLYFFLIQESTIEYNFAYALLYGVAAGITGIVAWRLYFKVLDDPLPYSLPLYLTAIWLGHVVLGVILYSMYSLFFTLNTRSTGIPLC